jgi:hypothetical protein
MNGFSVTDYSLETTRIAADLPTEVADHANIKTLVQNLRNALDQVNDCQTNHEENEKSTSMD